MDALKLGAYLVSSSEGCRKPDQAVVSGIAGFHGDFAATHGPSFAAHLRLLRCVVSNVRIIAGARPVIRSGMPETDRTSRITLHVGSIGLRVDSKLIGRQRISFRISVMPNFVGSSLVGIVAKRKVSGQVEGCRRRC